MAAPRKRISAKQMAAWADQYQAARPLYEALVLRLDDLLKNLLEGGEIEVAQIEGRAKTIESFGEKIRRKGSYADPLSDMTDLVGFRIITYTVNDVVRVGELLTSEFAVDEDRSVVKPELPDPDRFGYVSTHYVLKVCPPRSRLPEWISFEQLVFEVQLRTVLQHAWAAIDHKLNYKTRKEIPVDLQRRLFSVSALLEVADGQLDLVEREAKNLSREYGQEIERGNLDTLAIDAASVDVYLRA